MFGFRYASVDDVNMRTRRYPVASNANWLSGALLVLNLTTNQWEECGENPAQVGAVALDEVGDGVGPLVPSGRSEFPEFTAGGVLVRGAEFLALYTGTPDVGDFGVTKGADGIWRVDFTETGAAACVRVVDISTVNDPSFVYPRGANSPFRYNNAVLTADVPLGLVRCKFLDSAAQLV